MTRSHRGFMLVELMVVMAIIAAAVALMLLLLLPAVQLQRKAHTVSAKSPMKRRVVPPSSGFDHQCPLDDLVGIERNQPALLVCPE